MGEVFANKTSVPDPMYDNTFERFPHPKPPHNFMCCIVFAGISINVHVQLEGSKNGTYIYILGPPRFAPPFCGTTPKSENQP